MSALTLAEKDEPTEILPLVI